MGHVHRHAHALHFPRHLQAVVRQPAFVAGLGRIAQGVLIVPQKRRHAHALVPVKLHRVQPGLEHLAPLHGQHEALLAHLGVGGVGHLPQPRGNQPRHLGKLRLNNARHVALVALAAGPQGKHLQRHAALAQPLGSNHQPVSRGMLHAHGVEGIGVRVGNVHGKRLLSSE